MATMRLRAAGLALPLLLVACARSGQPDGVESPPGACEGLRAHVRSLYLAATPLAKDGDAATLADEITTANVDMVLTDCRRAPDRIAPCVERATDVATVEHDCMIQLDDEGRVDGAELAGSAQ
jgi:hypothetical protein